MKRRLPIVLAVLAVLAALFTLVLAQQLEMPSTPSGSITPDIDKLRKAQDLVRILDDLEFEFVDDPAWEEPSDASYLSAEEKSDPGIAANVEAMAVTNKLIAWFGRGPMGYVGLWRGPSSRPLADAPVVVLDDEGQYRIVATTIADFILVSVDESAFSATAKALHAAGFHPSESHDAVWGTLEAFRDDDPNDYRDALYYKALSK